MSFVAIARYVTEPSQRARVLESLESMAAISVTEPGCQRYDVYAGTDDGVVAIVEEYDTEEDFQRHCESEHFNQFVLGEILPKLLERTVTRCVPAIRSTS